MKRPILLATATLAFIFSYAQEPALSTTNTPASILDNYRTAARFLNNRFICSTDERDSLRKVHCNNCKIGTIPDSLKFEVNMITSNSFDTLFKPILSNVFIGNNDLAQNTTASGFTQDADKGTLSINYSIFPGEKRKTLWNIGVFSKSSDGIFGIYSAGAWSSEVGFNISPSFLRGKTRFFDDDECRILRRKRTAQIRTILDQYENLLQLDTTALKDSINLLRSAQLVALDIDETVDYGVLAKSEHRLDSLNKKIARIYPKSGKIDSYEFYRDILQEDIGDFEKTNAKLSGYKFWWWAPALSISNNKIQAKTDSLSGEVKNNIKIRNTVKVLAGIGIHRIRDSKRVFKYYNLVMQLGLRNALDQPAIKDPYLKLDPASNTVNVFNKNGDSLTLYDLAKANIKTLEPSAYYSIFFVAKKTIGLDIRFTYRFLIDKPEELSVESYPNYYTVSIGPIFRLKKEEGLSKGTIGIEAGIIDAPVKTNAWEFFGARLKVGLPINALIK